MRRTLAMACIALMSLTPLPGSAQQRGEIEVITDPPGAVILLDDLVAGRSPIVLSPVFAGPHLLGVRCDGFLDTSLVIQVRADTLLRVEVRLDLPSGLLVTSEPDVAIVGLNDRVVGRTPLAITGRHPGKVKLTVIKEGFDIWKSEVLLAGGANTAVRALLVRTMASVGFHRDVPATEILLDGRPIIDTGAVLVALGTHRVTYRNPSVGREFSASLDLLKGTRYTVTGRLGYFSWARVVVGILLPGVTQIADGSIPKGGLLLGGSIASILYSNSREEKNTEAERLYRDADTKYRQATTEAAAVLAGERLRAAHSELSEARRARDIAYVTMGGVLLLNAVDIFLNHSLSNSIDLAAPGRETSVRPAIGLGYDPRSGGTTLTMSIPILRGAP